MTIETFTTTTLGAAAASVVERLEPKREPFAPGIYFGLDESVYHADPALGSSAMKALATSPPEYWFNSPHNPMREEDTDTPARKFGRAVHKFVLEGREAFEARYAPTDYPGNIKAGKEERERIAAEGKEPIKREDWNRIMMAGTIIRSNPSISSAFSGGMPEVSVFWERGGIRRKARFDYLKPRAIVDLKSNANQMQRAFPESCRRAISDFAYHVQSAHYGEGRERVPEFIAAGAVYGDHDPEWLKKVAAATEWAFCFVFYQSQGAPLTWGTTISPGNGILDIARATIARAEENYKAFSEKFGFDTPWVLSEPLEELDLNEMPAWAFR
jgi:hypothetical protein